MSKSRTYLLMLPLTLLAGGVFAPSVQAQGPIFRCPGTPVEYINDAQQAKARGCKPMEGGNITIIQGTTPRAAPAPAAARPAAASRSGGDPVDPAAQRARESDARAILENELRQAQERLAKAKADYADGQPPKQGIEGRNHQRYLDRVADLKAELNRAESDVAGIQRELERLGAPKAAPGSPAR
ncbi:MAG: hypothetical protein R3E94_04160 [Burkholderiaceae bacterium]